MTELTEAEFDQIKAAAPGVNSCVLVDVAEEVERIIDARLAPIRALLDGWEATPGSDLDILNVETQVEAERFGFHSMRRLAGKRLQAVLAGCVCQGRYWCPVCKDRRDALDAASAPVSAQQDHDGAEGQGEGCETCRGEVWCPICEDRREAALPPLVHNHLPYRPPCAERVVDGQLRGACLNDDGSPR